MKRARGGILFTVY